jgi:hypothetical protein
MKMNMRKIKLSVVSVIAAAAITLTMSGAARAHCDTMDGPVIKDAQASLANGDVTATLKWVPEKDAAEIRHAFAKTLAVRDKGQDARELADMYFFETLVRLHRASEGEPYTGVKPAGTPIPLPETEADQALESGQVDELARKTAAAVKDEIEKRFAAAMEARKHKDESVDAGRHFVAAYVAFFHYVESVHNLATAHHGHAEHAPGHQAAAEQPAPAVHEHSN